MATNLTPAQHAILAYAVNHTEGKIAWFPDNIKGGARKKVLEGMINRALITTDQENCLVAPAGYDALGMPRPAPAIKRKARDDSKQARVIDMLKRPEGATIAQICEATGWQQHTVRGTFAGAFKKKLGLTITSSKESGADRIYKVAT